MRKEEGGRTGNSDRKREINQNRARGAERVLILLLRVTVSIKRTNIHLVFRESTVCNAPRLFHITWNQVARSNGRKFLLKQ